MTAVVEIGTELVAGPESDSVVEAEVVCVRHSEIVTCDQ